MYFICSQKFKILKKSVTVLENVSLFLDLSEYIQDEIKYLQYLRIIKYNTERINFSLKY